MAWQALLRGGVNPKLAAALLLGDETEIRFIAEYRRGPDFHKTRLVEFETSSPKKLGNDNDAEPSLQLPYRVTPP